LKNLENQDIIFFDGICGLCNKFIDFILRHDKGNKFLFSTLQGETAKKLLPLPITKDLESVVFIENGFIYYKSGAALRILTKLGGIWKIMKVFLFVPKFVRDLVYDFIAKNRYNLFGKKETCRLPTPEEKTKFLH